MTINKFSGTGGQILAATLAAQEVKNISCVAGESYLAVLDALLDHPEINVVTCRQEGGAAFMAESWGKLTGRPGICFVTRGPGATNASIGVHTAMQDSTPMILFMGQVGRNDKNREAFQEISVVEVFGGLAKWAVEIDDAQRIPEIVHRAFKTAMSGRPGPVVIGLPEDMLVEKAEVVIPSLCQAVQPHITMPDIEQLREILSTAQRPIAIVGGSYWSDQACADFMSFASACHLPVTTSFRRQDIINHNHNCYVGELGTGPNPKLIEKIKESDVVLVMGARLDEIATQGYSLFEVPCPAQKIIHIHSSENELGKVYIPALSILSEPSTASHALADLGLKIDGRPWASWRDELRQLYTDWTNIDLSNRPQWDGPDVTALFDKLRDGLLPPDAIITTDAGNFSGWAQRYLRYGRPNRLLAPISGAMGYSVPSAIGAAIQHPDRLVVGMCGDGGFMMNGQEIATAMMQGAAPIIMLFNNGIYGTIRMHQMREYPNRPSATTLHNPDFVALAKAYGAYAAVIDKSSDFPAIFREAQNSGKLALLEVRMDPRQLTTNAIL
jgi:acetolactate synthase-1/2/3 large subunit